MEFERIVKNTEIESPDFSGRLVRWPQSYYDETEAEIRFEILRLADEAKMTLPENEIRKKLFDLRYSEHKEAKGKYIDNFLRAYLEMKYLSDTGKVRLFKSGKIKQLKKALSGIKYYDYLNADETEKKLYYNELVHMAKLYVTLCNKDKHYGSVLLGLGRMKDENLKTKIANDVRTISHKIPENLGLEDEMEMWTSAIDEGFASVFPSEFSMYKSL